MKSELGQGRAEVMILAESLSWLSVSFVVATGGGGCGCSDLRRGQSDCPQSWDHTCGQQNPPRVALWKGILGMWSLMVLRFGRFGEVAQLGPQRLWLPKWKLAVFAVTPQAGWPLWGPPYPCEWGRTEGLARPGGQQHKDLSARAEHWGSWWRALCRLQCTQGLPAQPHRSTVSLESEFPGPVRKWTVAWILGPCG